MDWNSFLNFHQHEFACPCCGAAHMDEGFMWALQKLRNQMGVPLVPTSGFRCAAHNQTVGGAPASAHLLGLGADVARPHGVKSAELVKMLIENFNGVGLRLHGDKPYFHVDLKPRVAVWTYS